MVSAARLAQPLSGLGVHMHRWPEELFLTRSPSSQRSLFMKCILSVFRNVEVYGARRNLGHDIDHLCSGPGRLTKEETAPIELAVIALGYHANPVEPVSYTHLTLPTSDLV